MTTTITVDRKTLLAAMKRVMPAVAGTTTALPVLAGVRIRVHARRAYLDANSLELSLTTRLDAAVRGTKAAAVVPAGQTLKLLTKVLTGPSVDITIDQGGVVLSSDGARTFPTVLPANEWPRDRPIDGEELKLSPDDVDLVKRVAKVTSSDLARPILTTVKIEPGHVVATDSYRLARARIEASPSRPFLLPRSAVALLPREGVVLTVGTERVGWSDGITDGSTHLVEGVYPDYEKVWPSTKRWAAVVNRKDLSGAAMRSLNAMKAFKEDDPPLELTRSPEGELIATVRRPDRQAIFEEAIPARTLYKDWKPIAFNPEFLAEGLSILDGDEVRIETTQRKLEKGEKPDPRRAFCVGSPAVLRDASNKDAPMQYLLMPVMIVTPTKKEES